MLLFTSEVGSMMLAYPFSWLGGLWHYWWFLQHRGASAQQHLMYISQQSVAANGICPTTNWFWAICLTLVGFYAYFKSLWWDNTTKNRFVINAVLACFTSPSKPKTIQPTTHRVLCKGKTRWFQWPFQIYWSGGGLKYFLSPILFGLCANAGAATTNHIPFYPNDSQCICIWTYIYIYICS